MSIPSRSVLGCGLVVTLGVCFAAASGAEQPPEAAAPTSRAATRPARPATDADRALRQAVLEGHLVAAQEAIRRGADVNGYSDGQHVPLVDAMVARKHRRELAQLLLESGADANAQERGRYGSALHYVQAVDIAALLIRHGADVNLRRASDGFSPLHRTAEFGNEAMAEQLLASGADVNATAKYGETPLLIAAGNGRGIGSGVTLAKLLLDAGADVNAATDEGVTPLRHARSSGSHRLAEFLESRGGKETGRRAAAAPPRTIHDAARRGDLEAVKKFLAEGARAGAAGPGGETLLHLAAQFGHTEVAALLIDRGADSRARDKYREPPVGWTPLLWATRTGCHHAVVQVLLSRGADVKAKNKWGETALHWAVQTGYAEAVQLLLKHGADVNARDEKGKTPMDYAQALGSASGRVGLLKVLREHGAEE